MHMHVIVFNNLIFLLMYIFSQLNCLFFFNYGRRQTIKVNMNKCLEIQSSLQILFRSNIANAEGILGKLRYDF